jgi:hypothetical protein
MTWQRAADTAATTAPIWKPPIDALFCHSAWMLNVERWTFLRLCRDAEVSLALGGVGAGILPVDDKPKPPSRAECTSLPSAAALC